MSITFETLTTQLEVETMPDFEAISARFRQGFEGFIANKKEQAVQAVLREDVRHETLVKNPDFVAAILNRVDEEGLIEKRYIFISLNPEARR